MKKKHILVFILVSAILPLVLIPVIVYLFEVITKNYPNTLALIALDLSERMTIGEFIALYLSLVSVFVTGSLAYLIYRLEQNNEKNIEKQEIIRVKRILSVLLHNGINRALDFEYNYDDERNTGDFVRVSEQHISMIATLGDLLSDKQFMTLNKIMETLKDMAEYEKDEAFYEAQVSVNKLIDLVTIPVYPMYKFYMKDLKSNDDVLSEEVIQLLNLLYKEEDQKSFSYGRILNSDGKIIMESFPNNYYKVYDDSGNIICDAIIDKNGIVEGEVKIITEEGILEFEGTFFDNERFGQGIEYLANGKKAKEGEWQHNQLTNGRIYDVMLDDANKILFEGMKQVESQRDLLDLETYSSEFKVGNIRVVNGEERVDKESIMNASDYLRSVGYE